MLIARQALDEFLRRELDNFLWMKKLTREQLFRQLCKRRVHPYFKTEPWLHQLVCFYIGVHNPEFLYLLDMGLGKSKIVLDLITQAQREGKLKRALITVPRKINLDSWYDDIVKHSDLEPQLVNCIDIEEKWERLVHPPKSADLTVIDYQSLHWALSFKKKAKKGRMALKPDEERVEQIKQLYNFIDMDESHKLGNHESLWFKLLRRLTATADFTYANTGTLFGKDVEAIWPQFYLVDKGETFGENLGLFRKSFFNAEPNRWGRGEKFTYDKRHDRMLNTMLQHRSLRYDETEVLDLPPRVPRLEHFTMTDEQRDHYMLALDGLINAGGNLEEMDGQWLQMRRICSGYMKWKDEHGEHVLRFKENPKLDGLERLLDELGGRSKAVVCYDYTETGRMICERLDQMKLGYEWFYGGTKDKSGSKRRFEQDDECRVFVMNTEAGGTGTDGLQKVARYLFAYETPTPPITRRQMVKRVDRPGQTGRVFIYDLVMRRSLDAGILRDLEEHRDSYASIVNGKRRPGRGFFLSD